MIGAGLYFRGRQYASEAQARTIDRSRADIAPTRRISKKVLYLRAFSTDSSIGDYMLNVVNPFSGSSVMTEEEQLEKALRGMGDVVAIGAPGEARPTPGALRRYASDAEWKDLVNREMCEAQLVVIRAGGGNGLEWELKQAIATVCPTKLLIVILGMSRTQYESFLQQASTLLPVPLPESDSFRRASGFIRFSADWKPTLLPLQSTPLLRDDFRDRTEAFSMALRPVYEDLGVQWHFAHESRVITFWRVLDNDNFWGLLMALAFLLYLWPRAFAGLLSIVLCGVAWISVRARRKRRTLTQLRSHEP